jgi:hypothetical protein
MVNVMEISEDDVSRDLVELSRQVNISVLAMLFDKLDVLYPRYLLPPDSFCSLVLPPLPIPFNGF